MYKIHKQCQLLELPVSAHTSGQTYVCVHHSQLGNCTRVSSLGCSLKEVKSPQMVTGAHQGHLECAEFLELKLPNKNELIME